MLGMLFLFLLLMFLSAYITSIDKYNGKVENRVNSVIWAFFILFLLFTVYLGGMWQ